MISNDSKVMGRCIREYTVYMSLHSVYDLRIVAGYYSVIDE